MKAQFFMNMNDLALSKNDELKYLILMREEYFKYKLKMYYFKKWKCRALYNRDLFDEENPFNENTGANYKKFKSKNIGQNGIYDSMNPYNEFNDNINEFKNNENNNDNKMSNDFGNNNGQNDFNNNINNNNNNRNNFDLINFNEDPKIIDNNQNENYNNKNGLFQLTGSKISFGPNQNQQLNNLLNSIDLLKNKALDNNNLIQNQLNNNNLENKNNFNDNFKNNNNDINNYENKNNYNNLDNIYNNKNSNDLLCSNKNDINNLNKVNNDINNYNNNDYKKVSNNNLINNENMLNNDINNKEEKNLSNSKLNFEPNQNQQLNNSINNIDNSQNKAMNNDFLIKNNLNKDEIENKKNNLNNEILNENKFYSDNINNKNNINNTNDISTKISTQKTDIINDENTNSSNKAGRFDEFNLIRNKNNLINLKDSNENNNIHENKNDLNSINISRSENNEKYLKNNNLLKQKKGYKNFDSKKLFRYIPKTNLEEEEKLRYKNSKYISTKYKDYLHSENNSINKKNKKENKFKNKSPDKIAELYKELKLNLPTDESVLKQLRRNGNSINNRNNNKLNIYNKSDRKIRIKPVNKERDLNADKIKEIDNLKKHYNNIKSNNFEDNLLKNGFFVSKNKKKNDIDNNENNDESSSYKNYNNKINELMEKYHIILEKDKKNKKSHDINYDYIKKIKGNEEGFYGNNNYQNIIQNNIKDKASNINIINNNNDFDESFHPKKFKDNNQMNISDYSNSVYNLLNNLDKKNSNNVIDYNQIYGYEDLINNINEPKIYRINKRRISRNKIGKNKKDKKSFLNSKIFDNSKNKTYVLTPMKSIPITNISFRARLKYFSDKKEKNMKKLLNEKREEENQIYTFQPKTGNNNLNIIKYNNLTYNQSNNINNYNSQKKVDLKRINNLYLDYKDKNIKIDELTKDYYKNSGISFVPKILDKNMEIKQYKNKIGLIPYLDRVEIYNSIKQPYNSEKNIQNFKFDFL